MKKLLLGFAAGMILGPAIADVVYTKIDANTVRKAETTNVAVEELKQRKQMYQSLIDKANADLQQIQDRFSADIAFWQAQITELDAAILIAK